jgi:hypothetical protein
VGAAEVLTTRVTPEIKGRVAGVVREEFLTELIWLRRLVLRELQADVSEDGARHQPHDAIECVLAAGTSTVPTPGFSKEIGPLEKTMRLRDFCGNQ